MRVTHGRDVNEYFQRYSLPHCSYGSAKAVDNKIEWCAFFSDVDHEIRTVKEGIRVTAAYILRRKDNAAASTCVPRPLEGQEQANKVRDSLLLGLRDERFLSDGGKIGCACIHQYTNQQVFPDNKTSSQPLDARQIRNLKGNDLLIASAAASAGLNVRLVPQLGHEYSCDCEGDFSLSRFPKKKKCPKRMSDDTISDFFGTTQSGGQLQNEVDIWIVDMDLAASTDAGDTEWSADGYFGNEGQYLFGNWSSFTVTCLTSKSDLKYFPLFPEASDISFYVNACFVIEVPNYSESRGVSNVTTVSVEVDAKPKAKAKKRKAEDSNESLQQASKKKKTEAKKPKAEAKKRKAEDLVDFLQQSSKKKKKKEKKAKDPNAPKRNLSAYIHYCNSTRDITKVLNPRMDAVKITKVVSANWKALSSHERAVWDAKAAADKERYQKDLAQYKETDLYARWEAQQAEGTEPAAPKPEASKPTASKPTASKPTDSDSVSDESSKKKRKKKKKKDPNAPKRNISAFMHYSKDTREEVKANQPDLTFGEISKVISVNWKALTDQQRAVWDEKAATDKVRYQRELAEYQASRWTDQDVDEAKMPAKKNQSVGAQA